MAGFEEAAWDEPSSAKTAKKKEPADVRIVICYILSRWNQQRRNVEKDCGNRIPKWIIEGDQRILGRWHF